MSVGCIIQARTGSKRLKNKVLFKIKNKSFLDILILRLLKAKKIDKIIIATTKLKGDKIIHKIAKQHKI